MEKRKWESLNYVLSKKCLHIVVAYYIVILIAGMIAAIFVMIDSPKFSSDNILLYTNVASLSVAGMLCSIQYLKRLYKACLNERVIFSQANNEIVQFGNFMYFVLRPVYAMAFVVVAEFALLSGVIIVTSVDFQINERFLYLCVVMSSIIGFSIGRVLDGFEALSSKKVNDALHNKGEK